MKKNIFYIIFVFLISTNAFSQKTENVFIVVIDGARYTETFGDSSKTYIPHLWNDLTPIGTLFTNFFNEGVTKTVSGHSSILTGTWQILANDGSERPHKPTLFEYLRRQTNSSLYNNYVIHGKSKLNAINYSDHSSYGIKYKTSIVEADNYDDKAVIDSVKKIVGLNHPKLTLINLPQVDNSGHDKTWEEYVAAIKQADSLVYDLWNFIQKDSVYHNKSTIFITNDHGRHTTDFTSHGDTCEGCRHIMLLLIGPEIYQDKIDTTYYSQIDIASTAARLLNFDALYSEGKIINAFISPTGITEKTLRPEEFKLFQNYPNPFNPNTNINFIIPEESFVELTVFDILGKKVKTLVNQYLPAGVHTAIFNAENLSNGVYFYQLKVEKNIFAKKMNLIK